MSIQSHDASQRSQGMLCVFGGLIIAFSKEILSTIGALWGGPISTGEMCLAVRHISPMGVNDY